MAGRNAGLKLTAPELAQTFADPAWAGKYPPSLTVDRAAALLQVPKQTVVAWSSQEAAQGLRPPRREAPAPLPRPAATTRLQRGHP